MAQVQIEQRKLLISEIQTIISTGASDLQSNSTQVQNLQTLLANKKLPPDYFSKMKYFEWYNFFLPQSINSNPTPISETILNIKKINVAEDSLPCDLPGEFDESPTEETHTHKKSKKSGSISDTPCKTNKSVEKCNEETAITSNDQFTDLFNRTKQIIEDYLKNPEKIGIVTFDGHGRTLFLLLHHYYSAYDESIKNGGEVAKFKKIPEFYFYEIDQATHAWHTIFFPHGNNNSEQSYMNLIFANIFAVYNAQTSETLLDLYNSYIIYLNFLSLPSEYGDMVYFINFIDNLKRLSRDNLILYISFTSRNLFKRRLTSKTTGKSISNPATAKLFNTMYGYIFTPEGYKFNCITRRNQFVTFKFIKTSASASDPASSSSSTKRKRPYYNKYLKYKIKYINLRNKLSDNKI
jgi:hypothetical protein